MWGVCAYVVCVLCVVYMCVRCMCGVCTCCIVWYVFHVCACEHELEEEGKTSLGSIRCN